MIIVFNTFSGYGCIFRSIYILFIFVQINAEFKRITTVALQSRFLSQIDMLSDKLLKVFQK